MSYVLKLKKFYSIIIYVFIQGQLYVIGPADDVYPSRTNNHKPIAPRTGSVIENIRSPGISVITLYCSVLLNGVQIFSFKYLK